MAIIGELRSGETEPEASLTAWWSVGVLLLLYVLAMLDRTIIGMMVEPIRRDLSISDVEMGHLMGLSFALCYAIAGIPLGWAVDRYSRRLVIFSAVTLWSLASAFCGLAETYAELFAARMVVGIGEAALLPAAYSLIPDKFPRRVLVTALGVFSTGAFIGGGVSSLVGGIVVGTLGELNRVDVPLFGEMHGWQIVFLATGLPGALLGLLVFTFREPTRAAKHPIGSTRQPALGAFIAQNIPLLLSMAGGFLIMAIAYNAVYFWTPAFLQRTYGMRPTEYGPAIGAVFAICGVIGAILGGRVVDHLRGRNFKDATMRYYRIALLVSAPAIIAGYLAPSSWLFFVALAVYVIFFNQGISLALATIQLFTPANLRGRLTATFLFFSAIVGGAIGPSLAPLLAEQFGGPIRIGLSIAVIIFVCSGVALTSLSIGMASLRRAVEAQESLDR